MSPASLWNFPPAHQCENSLLGDTYTWGWSQWGGVGSQPLRRAAQRCHTLNFHWSSQSLSSAPRQVVPLRDAAASPRQIVCPGAWLGVQVCDCHQPGRPAIRCFGIHGDDIIVIVNDNNLVVSCSSLSTRAPLDSDGLKWDLLLLLWEEKHNYTILLIES